MSDYNGMKSVGQFSTDNRQSDEMQIAEEQGPEEWELESLNFYKYEQEIEDEGQVEVVVGCDVSGEWWASNLISEDEYDDYEATASKLHQDNCPCGNPDNLAYGKI